MRRPNIYFWTLLLPAVLIIIGLIVTLVIFIAKLVTSGGEKDVDNGSLNMVIADTNAVVIRDEASYSIDSEYSRAEYIAGEGKSVEEGEPLAVVYNYGYRDDVEQNLYEMQKRILEKQNSLMIGTSSEINDLNIKIQLLLEELYNIRRNGDETRKVADIENELKEAMTRRRDLVKSKVQPDEELNGLYAEEEALIRTLTDLSSNVIAKQAGVVSFYFDGYEQSLIYDKIDLISSKLVSDAIKNGGYSSAPVNGKSVYRLINTNKLCIAFNTDSKSINRLCEGEEYTVKIKGFENLSLKGVAKRVVVDKERVLNVIEFDNVNIGELIYERKVVVTVTASFSGIKVKKSAIGINSDTGETYISVPVGNKVKNVIVNVLAVEKDYAIIKTSDESWGSYNGSYYGKPKMEGGD